MKIMKYLNLFLLLFSISIYAQQSSPEIEFETTTIDYGVIQNGSDGERVFSFKNTGTANLIITNIRSSCGCTIPKNLRLPLPLGKQVKLLLAMIQKELVLLRKQLQYQQIKKTVRI